MPKTSLVDLFSQIAIKAQIEVLQPLNVEFLTKCVEFISLRKTVFREGAVWHYFSITKGKIKM